METTREIALRTYNTQVELGMPHNAMNWHLWKKAFDIADIELSKLRQPDVIKSVCISCDEETETHEVCMKCISKMIADNQQTVL